MIKAIIFDCFGVLYGKSFEYVRDMVPSERRPELEDLRIQHDRGYLRQNDFLQQIGQMIGQEPEQVRALMGRRHVLNTKLVDYIVQLKQQYKIGLLSNVGQGWLDELFPESLHKQLFDSVVTSESVHMIKPEPEIYRYAATDLGMLPEECCLIDDLPRNVEGAKAVGMQAVLFSSTDALKEQLQALGVGGA